MVKKEKIDESKLYRLNLKFSGCDAQSCTAEADATDDTLEKLRTAGGFLIIGLNTAGKPLGYPVPLTGFASTYAGPPSDKKAFEKERAQKIKDMVEQQRKAAGESQ